MDSSWTISYSPLPFWVIFIKSSHWALKKGLLSFGEMWTFLVNSPSPFERFMDEPYSDNKWPPTFCHQANQHDENK